MSIVLKRKNVVKEVTTKEKADYLVSQGFEIVKEEGSEEPIEDTGDEADGKKGKRKTTQT